MEEANTVKYYLARYFFLALSVLQVLAATLILFQYGDTEKNRTAVFVMMTLAMIFFSLHLLLATKLKRVAVSKKKLAIIRPHKVKEYTWSDVKDLKLIPFLNMYRLKLKGKKSTIYFLPFSDTSALFGIFTGSGLLPKKPK
jgi:hypothetical protein